jgi:hypothetical protein
MRLKLVDGYASVLEQFQATDAAAQKSEHDNSTLHAKLEALGDKCDGVRELIASKEKELKNQFSQAMS